MDRRSAGKIRQISTALFIQPDPSGQGHRRGVLSVLVQINEQKKSRLAETTMRNQSCQKSARRAVISRVLFPHGRRPFIWDAPCGAPHATNPDGSASRRACPSDEKRAVPIRSCSGRGLPSRRFLQNGRCALTAPFHPYLPDGRRFVLCGAFPRPLPAGRALPGVLPRWSPDFPQGGEPPRGRLGTRLTASDVVACKRAVKSVSNHPPPR